MKVTFQAIQGFNYLRTQEMLKVFLPHCRSTSNCPKIWAGLQPQPPVWEGDTVLAVRGSFQMMKFCEPTPQNDPDLPIADQSKSHQTVCVSSCL
jgi:hypothetical protein